MALDDTPLDDEISFILNRPPVPIYANWTLTLLTPDGEEIFPTKLLSLDIERNYINNYTDLTIADAVFPLGVYRRFVLANKEDLKAEVVRYPRWMHTDPEEELPPPDDEGPIQYMFKAVLIEEDDDVMGVRGSNNQTQGEMDLRDLVRVRIQLLDPALEELQKMEVGGIYRDEIPLHVARYILTQVSDELDVADEDAIYGVDMVEPDNTEEFEHVIIPQGTKPWDVAALIQRDWGGCYNAGIGCYLQDHHWYLWPLFNTRRFEDVEDTLTVFNIPPFRYRGIEKTWRLTDRQLIIIATGDSDHIDESHHQQLNIGSGERFTHGDRVLDGFGDTYDNKFVMERKRNNSEYVAVEKEGYLMVGVSGNHISNNSFHHASQFANRKGSFVHLVWENSRHELVYPGMPTKYVFLDKVDELIELDAVVVKAHHFIHDRSKGFVKHNFFCNTALTLFVEKYKDE